MSTIRYYFPGIFLIAIALTILAFPQILVAMIVAVILMAGFSALYIGRIIKSLEGDSCEVDHDGFIHPGSRQFHRVFHRIWHDRF